MKRIVSKFILPVLLLAMTFILVGCNADIQFEIDKDENVSLSCEMWASLEEYVDLYSEVLFQDMSAEEAQLYTALLSAYMSSDEMRDEIEASFKQDEEYLGTRVSDNGYVLYGLGGSETGKSEDVMGDDGIFTTSEFVFNPLTLDVRGFLSKMIPSGISEETLVKRLKNSPLTISVTMPDEIVLTNGTLSKDKKTAYFTINKMPDYSLYAYTAKEKNVIELDGTIDGQYTHSKKVKVISSEKIKSVTVNGVVQKDESIKLSKKGIYEIKVETDKSEKTFTVIRDTKAPKVSGVKNGVTYDKDVKIKFSDKDSGIYSASLNDEKITSKTKIKDNGEYTLVVTDNAGNIKTVNFTVNK